MELIQLSIEDFTALTASNAPAPGGGSISALCGGLSAALAQMVASLTTGKKAYEQHEELMQAVLKELPAIQKTLLCAVDEDTRAFDSYMDALKLPKGSDERKEAMQNGLKKAAEVPFAVAQTCCKLFPYLEQVLLKGNSNAVTDALVAVMLARTCVLGAVFNVRVNLMSIQDGEFVSAYGARCDDLQLTAEDAERRLLASIPLANIRK